MQQALRQIESDFKAAGSKLTAAGASMSAAITAPIVGAIGGSAKAAIDFESAFAGVRKTVGGTQQELDAIAGKFRQLATTIPVSAVELSKVGEMAGQLGVKKEKIVEFTKTIADISVATNLTADQAGASFARLANIMKLPQDQFSNLGSAVVALGNFGASTEQEMLDMALRISGAGATAGLSAPQVLGLANALSSVGLEAEAGGTAMSKVIIQIAGAAKHGGAELQKFAAVAGVSAAEFKKAFEQDAGNAVGMFLKGLGRIKETGGDLLGTVQKLGFEEVRLRDAMLRAANAGSLVGDSLALGSKSFKENTELTRAAEERYKTTANQLKLLWNQITEVGITLGQTFLPILRNLVDDVKPVVQWVSDAAKAFGQLPQPVQTTAFAIAGIAAAIGPVLVIAGTLISAIGSIAGALALIAPAAGAAAGAAGMGGAGVAAGALGTALGALGTVAAATAAFFAGWKFGSWIGEVTGATDAVGKLAARMLYGKDAAEQYAASRAFATRPGAGSTHSGDINLPADKPSAAAPPAGGGSTGGAPFDPLAGMSGGKKGKSDLAKTKKEIEDLDKVLQIAAAHNVDAATLMKEYGSQIVDATNKAKIFGIELPKSFETAKAAQLKVLQDKSLVTANEQARKILEANAKATAKLADEQNKESNKRYLDGLKARTDASTQLLVEQNRATMSSSDFEISEIARVRDADLLALDHRVAGWQETATAIEQTAALKMKAVREAHDAEVAQMKASINSWGNLTKGWLDSIPGLLQSAFTGGGGLGGALKGLLSNIGGDIGTKLFSGPTGLGAKLASGLFNKGMGGELAAKFGGMLGSLGGPLGSLALSFGLKLGKKLFDGLFGHAGRDAVKNFAATFEGGFDGPNGLHAQLNKLGAEGERMWIQLTQKTGKNDTAGARKIIDEITAALAAQKTKEDELAAAATTAGAAQTAASQQALDAIKGMNDEIAGLQQSIADEAPEEEMGNAEKLVRAKIDAIAKQRDAAQKEIDAATAASTESTKTAAQETETAMTAAADAAHRLADELSRIPRDVGVHTHYSSDGEPPAGVRPTEPPPIIVPGAADGVFATKPLLRVFGEGGEPELGGPVGFMKDALVGALTKLGATSDSGGGSGMPSGVTLVVQGNDTGELKSYLERTFIPLFIESLRRNAGGSGSDLVQTLQNLGLGS
jgi:TP901 family phage tail tape measure protein